MIIDSRISPLAGLTMLLFDQPRFQPATTPPREIGRSRSPALVILRPSPTSQASRGFVIGLIK